MSRLVIAEKPSVAQSIASVLGAVTRTMPSGAMRTCRSCRRNGSIRWPPTRKSSLTC